jgi:hypothetical protein
MPEAQPALYCGDPYITSRIGESECCSSCHREFDGGEDSPLEVELPDGRWALVCCWVSSALREAPAESPST